MGVAQNGTKNGGVADPNTAGRADDKMLSYSSAGFAITFAGQTDGGLTFGASFDLTAGDTYALADDDGFDTNGGAFGSPSVYIAGSFGKLTISTNNLDGFDGDELDKTGTAIDGVYDAQYDGTFGGFTVGVLADLESGLMSAKVGYTVGAVELYADFNQSYTAAGANDDIWNVSATYNIGAIGLTASTDNAENAALAASYTMGNGLKSTLTYNTNGGTPTDDPSIDLEINYAANGLSVDLSADDVGQANTTISNWQVDVGYDLGGGLSVHAGANYTEDMYVGAAMSF